MSGSSGLRSCLFNAVASAWVDLYHAAFVSKKTLQSEQQQIRVSLVQKELSSCQHLLCKKEQELNERQVSSPFLLSICYGCHLRTNYTAIHG